MKPDISIGIIPLRNNNGAWEVLLVQHRESGYWGFPKGHVEAGEDPKICATRELLEETGLIVEHFLPYEPLRESYLMVRGEQKVEKENHYFLAVVTGQLSIDEYELMDGTWFSLSDAAAKIGYSVGQDLCLQAQKILESSC